MATMLPKSERPLSLASIRNRAFIEKMKADLGIGTTRDIERLLGIQPSALCQYTNYEAIREIPAWIRGSYELFKGCPEALAWAKASRIGFAVPDIKPKKYRKRHTEKRLQDI